MQATSLSMDFGLRVVFIFRVKMVRGGEATDSSDALRTLMLFGLSQMASTLQ